jgi:uncharacterized C2H2 Zn-finger protein
MEEKKINKSSCECCNLVFRQARDYDNHIKTQKHLKAMLKIDSHKCPYCDYQPVDKSNMSKHINNVHKIIVKEAKVKIAAAKKAKPEVDINDKVVKMYFGLREARDKLYWQTLGMNSRYKRNLKLQWKPEELLMIELKEDIKTKTAEYANIKKQTQELEEKFTFLKELIVPLKPISDDEDDEKYKTIEDIENETTDDDE